MIELPPRVALIVLLACATAGCAFTASPADGLRFKAPAGWKSSPGILGFMQFWRPPSDDREVLMLFKSPKRLDERDVFSNDRFHDTLKDVTIVQRRRITICGSQPAEYIEARGSSSQGRDDSVDMMMTTTAGSSYFAMYVRPRGAAPNPMAAAALRELCAKS